MLDVVLVAGCHQVACVRVMVEKVLITYMATYLLIVLPAPSLNWSLWGVG